MALTHTTAVRNGVCSYVASQTAAGSANPTPRFRIKDGSANVLATLDNSATPFAAPANGQMQANAITASTATAAGNAATFEQLDRDGNVVFTGVCGTVGSGADAELNKTNFAVGDNVAVTSYIYSAAAF